MLDLKDILNEFVQNPEAMEKALHPWKKIYDFDPSTLRIDTLPSGFASLDEYLFLKKSRGELVVIGGRPSMGKSAFMFQLAFQVAEKMPVQIFSLEMDHEQIVTRWISGFINRPITAIQRGLVSQDLLDSAKLAMSKYQCDIDDRGGMNVHQLCDIARQIHKKENSQLVVVDYLQMLKCEKGHSKDDEIGTITRELKQLAKDLKVPVVVGSQLNRQNETRGASSGDYRPLLSDLRESGNIEQDADIVALIHRESRYTGLRPGEADIIIAKNRNGPTGDIKMGFVATQAMFTDFGGSI